MSLKIDLIQIVGIHKHINLREIKQVPRLDEDGNPVLNDEDEPVFDSGGYHRRVLTPDMTLADDEHQEIKDKAELEWTDEVKSAWTTEQAEEEANQLG